MSEKISSPLHMTEDELRLALNLMNEAVLKWHALISEVNPAGSQYACALDGQSLKKRERIPLENLPEKGDNLSELISRVVDKAAVEGEIVGHPGYFAYVAGAGNLISALAQSLTMTINPYTGTYSTAPALVEIEDQVIRWFCSIVGYPDDAAGILTTGSSLAIMSAVVAARERAAVPFEKARIYVTDQTHHSVGKACFIAGFKPENLVVMATRDLRMDVGALISRVQMDRMAGLEPIMVVATCGTTNAGRVDHLWEIGRFCNEQKIWFHCDAAYGGFFRLLPDCSILKGIELSDSISLDPHKSLSIPYGTGALLVKNVRDLAFPRMLASSYMPDFDPAHLRYEYSEISPELSRDWRGFRIWLALKYFGIAPFRDNLAQKLQMTQHLAAMIRETRELVLVTEPDLTIVTFRIAGDEEDVKTRELHRRINSSGRYYVTGCMLYNSFTIRVCLLGFRCDEQVIENFKKDLLSFLQ